MVSRHSSLGLILVCALVSPAMAKDGERTPVARDLGEAIRSAPAVEGRDVLGQSAALVSAAQA